MKKCLKCGAEYSDDVVFCKACGEKLTSTNVCQRCGHPVEINDVYCGKCGYKIEKEYRCEKCGALMGENAKFCPECGNKVEKPVVSIAPSTKKPKKGNLTDETFGDSIWHKVLYYVAGSVGIAVLLLLLIGCFGDILKFQETIKYGGSADTLTSSTSIEYFFGKAFRDLNSTTAGLRFNEYKVVEIIMIVLEYLCWLSAIVGAILGLIFFVRKFVLGATNKSYILKDRFLWIAILCAMPYLIIFGSRYVYFYSVSTMNQFASGSATFGWGTLMIMIASLIGVCSLSLYKLGIAIIEKREIVRESILSGIKIAFFFVLTFGIQRIVDMNGSLSYGPASSIITAEMKGYASSYPQFRNALYAYSAGSNWIRYATKCLLGPLFIMICGGLGIALMFVITSSRKKMIASIILGTLIIAFAITGYLLAFQGELESMRYFLNPYPYIYDITAEDKILHFSGTGIVLIVFTALSVAGVIVSERFRAE